MAKKLFKNYWEFFFIGIIGSSIARFFEYYARTNGFTSPSYLPLSPIIFGVILWNTIFSILLFNLFKNSDIETKAILLTPLYWIMKEFNNYLVASEIQLSLYSFMVLIETLLIALPIGISVVYIYKKLKRVR